MYTCRSLSKDLKCYPLAEIVRAKQSKAHNSKSVTLNVYAVRVLIEFSLNRKRLLLHSPTQTEQYSNGYDTRRITSEKKFLFKLKRILFKVPARPTKK